MFRFGFWYVDPFFAKNFLAIRYFNFEGYAFCTHFEFSTVTETASADDALESVFPRLDMNGLMLS